ncbi:hypothetical protein H4582DRAFT_1551044 [Lactarius indigo]|nr:hypothetical protein H4582DRAFT_1551044 [Lactarius indigo]
MGTTGIDLWSYQISREQRRAAYDYLSGPLPESPHGCGTSLDFTVPDPLVPFERLGSAFIEASLGTGDLALTPSASLTQDYDPSLVGITFQTGAYQPDPPTGRWPFHINNTTPPATTTPGDPRKCPVCSAYFTRWQDCDRHIEIHLPHWIHCPFQNCTWRGNRVKPFKIHWEKVHGSHSNIPGREQFKIYNTQEFVNQIKAGDTHIIVAGRVIERVRAKANQLGKLSMSVDPWGWTFKQPPQ